VRYDYKWQSRHHRVSIINSDWQLVPQYSALSKKFGSLDAVFALIGEPVTRDGISEVIRVEHAGVHYYVKRYRKAGKGLRKYFGRPRIQNEWESLQWFAKWGIPTAPLIAYGMKRSFGRFIRGAMVTQEIPSTTDLARLARKDDACLGNRAWVNQVSLQLAKIARTLHQNGFIHNDLKWRNLLVDGQDKLYLIDCPLGGFWRGRLLKYRIIKDIANLDRVARYKLSRTQRLRFFLQYLGHTRLTDTDKKILSLLLTRPRGRISSFDQHRVK